jgi:hypothetical protein
MCIERKLAACVILAMALTGFRPGDANAQWTGTFTGEVVNPNGTPANSPWTKDTIIVTVYCMTTGGGHGTSLTQVYNGSVNGGTNFSVPFSTANCTNQNCAVVVSFQVAAGGTELFCTNAGNGILPVNLTGGVSGGAYSFGTVHLTKTTCDCGNLPKAPEPEPVSVSECVSPRRGLFRFRCR